MGFYQDHILPHLIHLAMRRQDFAPYRERSLRTHKAASSKSGSAPDSICRFMRNARNR